MAKKKLAAPEPPISAKVEVLKPPPAFPEIFPKEGLECRTLLEDQIIVVDACRALLLVEVLII